MSVRQVREENGPGRDLILRCVRNLLGAPNISSIFPTANDELRRSTVDRLRGQLFLLEFFQLRRWSGGLMEKDVRGFFAPVHRALTEPILLGGAPRTVAIANGTLADSCRRPNESSCVLKPS